MIILWITMSRVATLLCVSSRSIVQGTTIRRTIHFLLCFLFPRITILPGWFAARACPVIPIYFAWFWNQRLLSICGWTALYASFRHQATI